MSEVRKALSSILQTHNMFGQLNTKVVVQKFVPGNEYVVNTISDDSHHLVVEVWKYNMREAIRPDGTKGVIYSHDELLDPRDDVARVLIEYAMRVLKAFGIQNGASHMELMMRFDGSPVLMEMGARIMGGRTEVVTRTATGTSALDLLVLQGLDRTAFRKVLAANPEGIIPRLRVANVQLITRQAGMVTAVHPEVLDGISSLRNPKTDIMIGKKAGDRLEQTTDLKTSPGLIWLMNEDRDQLYRDIEEVRRREARIFEIAP